MPNQQILQRGGDLVRSLHKEPPASRSQINNEALLSHSPTSPKRRLNLPSQLLESRSPPVFEVVNDDGHRRPDTCGYQLTLCTLGPKIITFTLTPFLTLQTLLIDTGH